MAQAVAVDPVKATPATRKSPTRASPTLAPSPGNKCSNVLRHAGFVQKPRRCRRDQAGFVPRAWRGRCCPRPGLPPFGPMKIANGKFQGLMHTKTPRPWRLSRLVSPVGPGNSLGYRIQVAPASHSSGRNPPPSRTSASASDTVRPASATTNPSTRHNGIQAGRRLASERPARSAPPPFIPGPAAPLWRIPVPRRCPHRWNAPPYPAGGAGPPD